MGIKNLPCVVVRNEWHNTQFLQLCYINYNRVKGTTWIETYDLKDGFGEEDFWWDEEEDQVKGEQAEEFIASIQPRFDSNPGDKLKLTLVDDLSLCYGWWEE